MIFQRDIFLYAKGLLYREREAWPKIHVYKQLLRKILAYQKLNLI